MFDFKKNEDEILKKNKILYILSKDFNLRINLALSKINTHNFKNILIVVEKSKLKETAKEIAKLNIKRSIVLVNFESLKKAVKIDLKSFDILKTNKDIKNYATEPKDYKLRPAIINGNFIKPDLIIIDQAHRLGSYPKLNKAAQEMRKLSKQASIIACGFNISASGQKPKLFNQLLAFNRTKHKSFYKFADEYVNVKVSSFQGNLIKQYDTLNKKGLKWYENVTNDIIVDIDKEKSYEDNDEIINVDPGLELTSIINRINKSRFLSYKNKSLLILDPEVKYKYMHQLVSGTLKIDDNYYLIDDFKIKYLKENFKNKKLLIICRFNKEKEVINSKLNNRNIEIIGYTSNLPDGKYDYIVFFSLTNDLIKYQNMISKYNKNKKIYLFCSGSKFEFDIYKKLQMQLNGY